MKSRMGILSMGFLFILSIILQLEMHQDPDMLFALEGGKRLLAGGTYVSDVFETNPPLIFYITMFINALSHVWSISSVFLFKLFTYLVIIYSLVTCHCLLNNNSSVDRAMDLLLMTLAFCLLILSLPCFGEREHLMIALTMPYFLLVYETASGKRTKATIRMIVSLLAAIGFAFKPYFVFSLVFAELWLCYWNTHWRSVFRLETYVIALVFILYLISVAVFMPGYYETVLPLVLDFYVFNHSGAMYLLTNFALINTIALLLSALCLHRLLGRMEALLVVISLGFMLVFLVQAKGWYYHALPLVTVDSLLAMLLMYRLVYAQDRRQAYPIFFVVILGAQCLFTLMPVFEAYRKMITTYKNASCGYVPLINIARTYAKAKPIFFFSINMNETLPIVYYSEATLGSRFPMLWLLSGILNREQALKKCDPHCHAAKRTLRRYITEDFKHYQPQLVFMFKTPQLTTNSSSFDYLAFMQKSLSFKRAWQDYCYLSTVNDVVIYRHCNKAMGQRTLAQGQLF